MQTEIKAFKRFSKQLFIAFILALTIGTAGIITIAQRVQAAYETTEVQLSKTDQLGLDEKLSAFIGEEVKGVPLAEHSSGKLVVDMDTVQGFYRFIVEQEGTDWQIIDAFRP